MGINISGKTRVVGLIGWPVSHTLSPLMHNAAFEAAGLDFVYVPFPVEPEHIADAIHGIRALGLAGVNVTIPHKEAVIPYIDDLSDEAGKIVAVNTIVNKGGRLFGYNTDVYGFLRALGEAGVEVKGARIAIVGAGGVARAMAIGSALEGAESITLTDIVLKKAWTLAADVERAAPGVKVKCAAPDSDKFLFALMDAQIVANATPLGMKPDDPLPTKTDAIPGSAVVFDAVYNLTRTPFQRAAKARGCTVIGGIDLLLYQGVRAFELWTGTAPDLAVMKKVLQEKLTQST